MSISIGIWHMTDAGLSTLLRRLIRGTPEFSKAKLLTRPEVCDIMISDGLVPTFGKHCRCRLAILPGDTTLNLQGITADRLITYGMSSRNTVTVSSVGDARLFLALQREIVGLTGRRLERQELVVRHASATPATLAAAAALLACGAEPEVLEHAFEPQSPAYFS